MSEIKTVDIESREKVSEICSKVDRGVKRCVKETRLAKAKLQSLTYHERLFLNTKTRGSIEITPNTFGKKT